MLTIRPPLADPGLFVLEVPGCDLDAAYRSHLASEASRNALRDWALGEQARLERQPRLVGLEQWALFRALRTRAALAAWTAAPPAAILDDLVHALASSPAWHFSGRGGIPQKHNGDLSIGPLSAHFERWLLESGGIEPLLRARSLQIYAEREGALPFARLLARALARLRPKLAVELRAGPNVDRRVGRALGFRIDRRSARFGGKALERAQGWCAAAAGRSVGLRWVDGPGLKARLARLRALGLPLALELVIEVDPFPFATLDLLLEHGDLLTDVRLIAKGGPSTGGRGLASLHAAAALLEAQLTAELSPQPRASPKAPWAQIASSLILESRFDLEALARSVKAEPASTHRLSRGQPRTTGVLERALEPGRFVLFGGLTKIARLPPGGVLEHALQHFERPSPLSSLADSYVPEERERVMAFLDALMETGVLQPRQGRRRR